MTELVYTQQALQDLDRLSDFLLQTDPQAAQKTALLIFEALEILRQHPEMGRKVHWGQRELVISRGRTGYLALYRFLPDLQANSRAIGQKDGEKWTAAVELQPMPPKVRQAASDRVLVLALRHQREAGYQSF